MSDNLQVKVQAKKFIKRYGLNGIIRIANLKQTAEELGYKVIYFDPHSPQKMKLLKELKADKIAESQKAFTWNRDSQKAIFIITGLEFEDEIFLLLHELSHIYMRHCYKYELTSVEKDQEANEFANYVIQYRKNRRIIKNSIIISSIAIIVTISIPFTRQLHKNNQNKNVTTPSPTTQTIQSVSPSPSPSPVAVNVVIPSEEPAVTSDEQDSVMVSVTKTGDKYHRSDCHYIVGRSIFTLSIEKATNAGYTACTYCRPDEK